MASVARSLCPIETFTYQCPILVDLRGESKFEKCTLSVKVTFRGWGSNSIDALSGIHVSLISKSILILTEILTLRGQGVGGSEDNVSLTLSVHFSNFDSPLRRIYLGLK